MRPVRAEMNGRALGSRAEAASVRYANTSREPSGDRSASRASATGGTSGRAVPPAREIRYTIDGRGG